MTSTTAAAPFAATDTVEFDHNGFFVTGTVEAVTGDTMVVRYGEDAGDTVTVATGDVQQVCNFCHDATDAPVVVENAEGVTRRSGPRAVFCDNCHDEVVCDR